MTTYYGTLPTDRTCAVTGSRPCRVVWKEGTGSWTAPQCIDCGTRYAISDIYADGYLEAQDVYRETGA